MGARKIHHGDEPCRRDNRFDHFALDIGERFTELLPVPGRAAWARGLPWAGSWSMKLTSYLSPNGKDTSLILAIAARVAWPPSATSVAIKILLNRLYHPPVASSSVRSAPQ